MNEFLITAIGFWAGIKHIRKAYLFFLKVWAATELRQRYAA